MLDLATVDLDELGQALDDHSYSESSWWLDPRTGEVRFHLPDADDETADDLDEAGLIRIDPVPSREGYGDMENFVARVPDRRAADLLDRAIQGRGAFRRFKDTLFEFPELRERWFAFHDARMRRRAIRWLVDEQLISDEAACCGRCLTGAGRPTTRPTRSPVPRPMPPSMTPPAFSAPSSTGWRNVTTEHLGGGASVDDEVAVTVLAKILLAGA